MEVQQTKKFVRDVFIEWGDCDPAGIVYYPRYFEMFDISTAHMIAAATEMSKFDLLKLHDAVGYPMVATSAEFRRPARYGDIVQIESAITAVGISSFEIKHRLVHGEELAIEAYEKRVWVARGADGGIRSAPIPEVVVIALRH